MQALKSTFLAMALSICCTQVCFAQSSEDSDDAWKDWKVTISPSSLQHYLDYPGSSIHGITKVAINYAQPDYSTSQSYEDLWYTQSKPIGCKRWQSLGITPGTAGVVQVINVNADQCGTVANAVLRMYVDLYLHKCMTKYIVVPHTRFNNIVASFRQQGFRPPFVAPGSRFEEPSRISIEIMSDDDVESQRLLMK